MNTTAINVNNVSNNAPSIFPLVPLQMCTLITKSNICPMAKERTASTSQTNDPGLVEFDQEHFLIELTHWFYLTKYCKYKYGFQYEIDKEKDHWHQEIQRVK